MDKQKNQAMDKNLIVVEQLPVITERLRLVSEQIAAKIAEAKSLAVNDETVKKVKTMRAGLNKDFTDMEDRRKAVKSAVLAPYEAFEAAYKQFVSEPYKQADIDLKVEIDRVENARRAEKTQEVKAYFEEYAASLHVDFVPWERAGIKIGLSDSMKSLKDSARAFINKVCDDLALIETQEYKEEILVDYRRTLNASQAITGVVDRHKAIEGQKARQAEIEARREAEREGVSRVMAAAPPPLEPPKVEVVTHVSSTSPGPVKTLTFRVTAPVPMLRELKRFLDDGGYKYE